ncbi:hypothetical protein V9T40_012125 [Parthenolecanium corni]|uniref:lactoylglutathione lyase n=1 Tax=Parthenolecanium corni TaxID=536013 RepID=A0AAN9XZ63_9HEMI
MADKPAISSFEEAISLSSPRDATTKDYVLQQIMYRIKDPKKSLKFYVDALGMTLLDKIDFPSMKFSLYFVGYVNPDEVPKDDADARYKWMLSKSTVLELTHNWGTENDSNFSYHNGNADPRGYGHIGIQVPDLDEACARLEKLNVDFLKKPSEGKMRGIAFIKDPDGYWIELLTRNPVSDPQS